MRVFPARSGRLAAVAALAALAGCSTIGNILEGDKIDYKSSTQVKSSGLEVPPDLTQLGQGKYNNTGGSVSAAALQSGGGPATAPVAVNVSIAPSTVGDVTLERQGHAALAEQHAAARAGHPLVKSFWKDNGFTLTQDRPDAGVIETDWAENRAKIPGDFIRNTIGKVFDSAFSTGLLDRFRIRIERTPTGSDIFVSHQGIEEVYVGERKDSTTWRPRPSDPFLESEFLARLMVRLGAKDEQAKTMVAGSTRSAPAGPLRARLVDGSATPTLQVDDSFDRAWRRVGIALDRSGFTVEDRDRTQGVYFVRYVDPLLPAAASRTCSAACSTASSAARKRAAWPSTGSRSPAKAPATAR